MKIAFLMKDFGRQMREGAMLTTLNLANALNKKGHKAVVITNRGFIGSHSNKVAPKKEKLYGVNVFRPFYLKDIARISYSPMGIFNRVLAQPLGVRKVQHRFGKFDVINSLSSAPLLSLNGLLTKFFNKDAVLIHSVKSKSKAKLGGINTSFLLNRFDKIIVPLASMKNVLVKQGVKEKKIAVIYSPINTKIFKPRNKEKLKAKYGLKNKKVVLYYGHSSPIKGIDLLPDIYDNLKTKNAVLIIRFSGAENETYMNYNKKGVQVHTHATKNTEEYVALADVVLLPYLTLDGTEGNPSCVLEAMASKTPVVSTKSKNLLEVFSDKEEILLAKPGRVKDIAKQVDELLRNKRLREKIISKGYLASKQFDAGVIAKQYEKLCKELVKQKKKRRQQ